MRNRKKISTAEIERSLIDDADNADAWEAPIKVSASESSRPQWYGRSNVAVVNPTLDEPCQCGSGQTYGKCCGADFKAFLAKQADRAKFPKPEIMSAQLGPFKMRFIWNKICQRPANEHLHEFLIHTVRWTLGEKWYQEQEKKSTQDKHVVMRWIDSRYEFLTKIQHLNLTSKDRVIPSGEFKELIALAADMYYLQLVNELPSSIKDRLRGYDEFQGARYEIAVAASLIRAGFEIEWVKAKKGRKHHEFDAVHKVTGETIAIEAKSRRRPGAFHQKGELPDFRAVRADIFGLYNEAMQQNPNDRPFGVFIDINVPHQSNRPLFARDWISNLLQKIAEEKEALFGSISPNFLAVTNSAWHYEAKSDAEPGEYMLALAPNPSFQFNNPLTVEAVNQALNVFSDIPDE
jgi:hypothetical protein